MNSFGGLFAELQTLYSRHADPSVQNMDNWPDETEPMKKVFQELLAPALGYYFKQNNIMFDGNNN
jgi:hypothetical protein